MYYLRSSKVNFAKTLPKLLPALCLLGLVGCQPAQSRVEPNTSFQSQTLVVSGRGMVDIPKTNARVSLGVQVQGETSGLVQQELAKRSQAVVNLLKTRQDVTKLETTSITLNPRYDPKDGKQIGYYATNIVRFQIAPEKIGALLDEAIKTGATRIDGITLVASDEAIAAAQKQAIDAASKDARSQADAALSALQLKQQEIVSIQINGARPPIPVPMQMADLIQKAAPMNLASTPVVAGEQRIEAFVTLQVRYQPTQN
ncbi:MULTISPECIES: SIMPL domain-containing protein [Nostoc]|uniref:SIMPL domain-containing protein n=1 Tax=Nostoc paludosum FACHB-159 TaxID=2692908 RepID=A0ABR8K1L8_9NOSO|nr:MULTISPECIES: SIMPL domain-containing protein [Nostoc]MBD2677089.1 SIMPL domain-containing protein [Nostoc sp. FACHB-857]MBD2733288.1 SIMPL domain-containing protein [Nostoc paludosum FACHB-159]